MTDQMIAPGVVSSELAERVNDVIAAALAELDEWLAEVTQGARLLDRETVADRILDVRLELSHRRLHPTNTSDTSDTSDTAGPADPKLVVSNRVTVTADGTITGTITGPGTGASPGLR